MIPIVGDAAVASAPVADGRALPVLILDVSARPEVGELLRVHGHLPGGDVKSQWASSRDDDDQVALILTFVRPMDVEVVLPFSIERQGLLVDTMMTAGGAYLQAGQAGDRLMTTMDAPRVLIELPETGFRPDWERLYLSRMTLVMARRGVPRRQARSAAETLIAETREMMAGLRMNVPASASA